MTHIYAVMIKKKTLPKLGSIIKKVHEKIKKDNKEWYYWYNGVSFLDSDKIKTDLRSKYPNRKDFYSKLLKRKNITSAITTWGCSPLNKPEWVESVKKLNSEKIASYNLPHSLPGTLMVSNKGAFSEQARANFGRQEIVKKTNSGFEIGTWLIKDYLANEEKFVRDAKTKSLKLLLSWVKTSYCVVIIGLNNIVAYNSGVNLYFFEDDEIIIVSSVENAVKHTIKELRLKSEEINKIDSEQTKIFSRRKAI